MRISSAVMVDTPGACRFCLAAVMTIVSVMEGMKQKSMEQFEAMGANRITVSIYSWVWDEDGNTVAKDYFPELYDYCNSMKECVVGVTPAARASVSAELSEEAYDYAEAGIAPAWQRMPELRDVMSLVWRMLLLWLVLLALLIIAGWVS